MSTRRGVTNSTRPYTFADMVENHQVEVLRYLRRLTGDVAEAEDLFQETFLRALSAFDKLRTGSNHRAWVYRVATHVFLNARRTKRRRKEVSLVTLVDALPAPGASVSDAHETKALAAVCRQAIASLPRRQRVAFVQRHLLDWGYREIAEAMKCSQNAARANVYQAARQLRRALARL